MKYMHNGLELRPTLEFYHDLIPYLGGIKEYDFYMDAHKCAQAWKRANDILEKYFSAFCKPRVPGAAPISYGHLISIGAPFTMPEDTEPNVKPFADSIENAIEIMKRAAHTDFGANELGIHYQRVNEYLAESFPEHSISPLSGWANQGVITTAVLMRGQDFFIDIYDEPELAKELLDRITDSILEFQRWSCSVTGQPEVSGTGAYIADDFAALIPPALWPEFVLPYWKRYYETRSTGTYRFLHCEGTAPEHLRYLKDIGITRYQPSVSDKLTIANVKANTDVVFDWLLYAWKVTDMSDEQIQAWVDETVNGGVSIIRTQIGKFAWSQNKQDRLLAFFKAFDKYAVAE